MIRRPHFLNWKLYLISALIGVLLFPIGAGAAEEGPLAPSVSNPAPPIALESDEFAIPLQEEGKVPIPPPAVKRWYKRPWVWTVIGMVAVGIVISLIPRNSDHHPQPVIQ